MGWGPCPYVFKAFLVFIHSFIRVFAFIKRMDKNPVFLHPATIQYIYNFNLGNSDNSNIGSKAGTIHKFCI